MDPNSELIIAILISLTSLFLIRDGWLMIQYGKEVLFLPQMIGFYLIKMFLGSAEAEKRRKQFVSPEKNRLHVIYGLIGGSMFLTIGIFMLVDAIIRL
jgi:hypothetical protein